MTYFHLGSSWRNELGVVNLDLSLGHLVQTLVDDAKTLSHLFNSNQIAMRKRGRVETDYDSFSITQTLMWHRWVLERRTGEGNRSYL